VREARTVTSIHGNRYRLGREIGRGGQGAVFAVEGERLAVKLLRDRSQRAREQMRNQLAMVGRLPLSDLAVARPIELLRDPDVGYVMELFAGMVPLRSLLRLPEKENSVVRWYFAGGGLRRRLRLLARAAEVLSELHGKGLVYVDPAPDNVFVSEDTDACEVRLIDTDNLRPSTSPGHAIFTPGYGAPEIVREAASSTSLSDAYAFAIIAFETLTLIHPFLGDFVQNGEPELEEQALSGALPWIDDPVDARNRTSIGIPRNFVLSDNLQEMFQTTFGVGRLKPAERPGMARWAEYLHRAADRTLCCPACRGHYYFNRKVCPWCGEGRPSFVVGAVLLWDPTAPRSCGVGDLIETPGIVRDAAGKPRVIDAVVVTIGEEMVLTDRITHGTNRRTAKVRLAFDQDRINLKMLDGEDWKLISSKGRERSLGDCAVDIPAGSSAAEWILHAGSVEQLHRIIHFDVRGGAADEGL
jgi:eukaryotic-like serine/threonine-protein kinase